MQSLTRLIPFVRSSVVVSLHVVHVHRVDHLNDVHDGEGGYGERGADQMNWARGRAKEIFNQEL